MTKSPTTTARTKLRSPCPVAASLDLFGDRWTLLIVRDLASGKTRFKEFVKSPEKIPTNILSERLNRLLQDKIIVHAKDPLGTKHKAYALTEKGEALFPILESIRDWGLTWKRGTRALIVPAIGIAP